MSKRVLSFVSILFLSSILVLSCSNAGKTGSGDNNSGNGGSSTGGDGGTGTGDGGTTQTPQGIAKYAGTWTATFDEKTSYELVIGNDGSVIIKDGTNNPKQARDITENGDTYTMKIDHGTGADNVTITFDSETTGSIDDIYGIGSITKIK